MALVGSTTFGKWLLPNFKRKVSKCNNNNNGSLWQFAVDPNQSKLSWITKFVIFHVIHDQKIGFVFENLP
jgi:hypothetical protein